MNVFKRIGSLLAALAIFSASLAATAVTAEGTVRAAASETVYSSADELFSAMRKVFKEHLCGEYDFAITEALRDEVCYYDDIYKQYRINSRIIYDFYGDQSSVPASEGDYLEQNHYGSTSIGVNGTTIELSTAATKYMTTLDQEAQFESKLKSLFAAGGALSGIKNASDYEKASACMKYIRENVQGKTAYTPILHTAYSALCEGTATCQGIALLYHRLLREVGIPNRILMGTDSASHTYNIVLIGGKYYYCDASANVLLKGSSDFSPAQLQEHYQSDEFKNQVLSKISAASYPVPAGSTVQVKTEKSENSTQQAQANDKTENKTNATVAANDNSTAADPSGTQAAVNDQSQQKTDVTTTQTECAIPEGDGTTVGAQDADADGAADDDSAAADVANDGDGGGSPIAWIVVAVIVVAAAGAVLVPVLRKKRAAGAVAEGASSEEVSNEE